MQGGNLICTFSAKHVSFSFSVRVGLLHAVFCNSGIAACSIGGAPGVGAYNGLVTNVTTLQTDFPIRGLNGTSVNVIPAGPSSPLRFKAVHSSGNGMPCACRLQQ